MKEKLNLKSIIVGLLVLIIGILLIILDLFSAKTDTNLWISIGCSLIASGLVILLNAVCVERIKDNPLKEWGISNIYPSRAIMNTDCEVSVDNAEHQVDVIAFGLHSYRDAKSKTTLKLLSKGVNFRIITMDPDSEFVYQRAKEEGEVKEQISNSIRQLVEWANDLNKKSKKGKITVKGYSCMTLSFYWRVDGEIYTGPYWYGKRSQQTISYKFTSGKTFKAYTEYFESLWGDEVLMKTLTK